MAAKKTIAIIGGGPAGSATAIALLNALKEYCSAVDVCLFNRPKAKGWHVGETIPPAATSILYELGIADILDNDLHSECTGSLSLWGGDQAVANDFMLDLSGTGFHLNRTAFDASLLQAACARGARLYDGYNLRSASEGFILDFIVQGKIQSIHADFVVDASGQSAGFARRLGIARNVIDEVISVYARIPLRSENLPSHTLVEATEQGWWYLSKIPGDQCIVSFTTDKHHISEGNLLHDNNWSKTYATTRWIKQFLSVDYLHNCELHTASACSAILSACVGERWLAVGDAASSYDSITSAGITKSLLQGQLAGSAIANFLLENTTDSLEQYQHQVFEQFNHYLGLRHHLYHREQRFADQAFWQRRLAV